MARKVTDADLLVPSLDEGYDELDFFRPWQPWHLIIVAFVGGVIGAAIVYPWNYLRLGRRRAAAWCLATFVLAIGITWAALLDARALQDGSEAIERQADFVGGLQMVGALCVAAFLSSRQQKHFRLFEQTGGEAGALFLPAVGAIVCGAVSLRLVSGGWTALLTEH